MARKRKHSHKPLAKLTRQQIMMIEDEWWARYNKKNTLTNR